MRTKVSDWINLLSSIAVIMGIIFLGMEVRQNTNMMRSQTRDSISAKQMMFSEWVTNEMALAVTIAKVNAGVPLEPGERVMQAYFMAGNWREWENSYYQFQQGLFDRTEFEPRMDRWRSSMRVKSIRDLWASSRENYAPAFRAEVDKIVEYWASEPNQMSNTVVP